MVLLHLLLFIIGATAGTSHHSDSVRTFEQVNVPKRNNNASFKTVCYYPMTVPLNLTVNATLPYGLDAKLCSHIIFIPTKVDSHNRISPSDQTHVVMFQRAIPVLRQLNPNLTIMISNGGPFDSLMQSSQNITEFVNSTVVFLRKYGFDGIDLDWEFPGWPITEKPHGQIHNYSIVLTELRQAFEMEANKTKKSRLLLTAAVAATKEMAEVIYEFDYFKKAVDFVNMMGYDYNGWGLLDPLTGYNSPLFPESYDKHFFNTNNLAWSANYWASKIGKDKVMVGIPFYCHAYKLLTSKMHGYHAIAIGKGECEQTGYTCACLAIKNKNATVVFDDAAKVPYCYYGDQWISYDNVESIKIKTKWIMDNGFPGLMVWEMIADDVEGVCDGITKYPLMKAVLKTIAGY